MCRLIWQTGLYPLEVKYANTTQGWGMYMQDILMLVWQLDANDIIYFRHQCTNIIVVVFDICEYKYINSVHTIYSGWI